MTSDELQALYAENLAAGLSPADPRRLNPKSTRRMLAQTRRGRGLELADADGVWLWSDLHLHHRNIIRYADRPHATVESMNAELLEAWRAAVAADDWIICAGDLALAGALRGSDRLAAVAACPGRQLLVVGNHDLTRKGRLAETGAERTVMALLLPGDPPLAVTHVPLLRVPAGCVNVHGHTHQRPAASPQHINVCVEQLGYAPVRVGAIRHLARRRLTDGVRASTTLQELQLEGNAGAVGSIGDHRMIRAHDASLDTD